MKHRILKHFVIGMVGLFLVASFGGLVTGTVAWYAYTIRAGLTYQGTSVSNAERIQIGLKSDHDFTVDEHDVDRGFGLTKQVVDGETYDYYWANPGSGFSSAAINAYLEAAGNATNTLEPVTTRKYIRGTDDFHLYKAPQAYEAAIENDASNLSYCKIDFVFRVLLTTSSVTPVYSANQKIWLSDSVASVSGNDININKALRLYFDDGTSNTKFIYKPTFEGQSGTTNVSGVLDLTMDGRYDFDSDGYEIIYGDYDEQLNDMKGVATTFTAGDIPDDGKCNDINGVNPGESLTPPEVVTADHSTFLARHTEGTKGYTKALLDTRQSHYAEHFGNEKVKPSDDGAGHLTGGMPICVTASSAGGYIGSTSMYIYIEGWDFSVIDEEVGHGFNLGLQFQIDRG